MSSSSKSSKVDVIADVSVFDIRFPTWLDGLSDAMHPDLIMSCAYLILTTTGGETGCGLTFTLGDGTPIVIKAIQSMAHLYLGECIKDIFSNFASFWRKLTSDSQMRWIGPEKGVIHLATAAIINALWDLWGKMENKPVWKLLADMSPEQIVSLIDFRYITDVLTPEEALGFLKQNEASKEKRIEYLSENGYPSYITSVGWLGRSEEKMEQLAQEALKAGWTKFKMKVGYNIEDERRRLGIMRRVIGEENTLMVDANQKWGVEEAIQHMQSLLEFRPLWIEEPTSPDDILGHAAIAKALSPHGIGVATGEHCHNRIMFKQFLKASAMRFCQIDTARLGGPNEVIAVLLMAKKFNVPVCPHTGGVGLCEMAQHMAFFNYIYVDGSLENHVIEYIEELHEHFVNPVRILNASYMLPTRPGYSTELRPETFENYQYPEGKVWQQLILEGKFSPS